METRNWTSKKLKFFCKILRDSFTNYILANIESIESIHARPILEFFTCPVFVNIAPDTFSSSPNLSASLGCFFYSLVVIPITACAINNTTSSDPW